MGAKHSAGSGRRVPATPTEKDAMKIGRGRIPRDICLTLIFCRMAVLCIDEQVWTSLVGKLKALSEQARRVQTQFAPKTSDG